MASYNKGRRKYGVLLTHDFFQTPEVFAMARDTGLSRGDVAHCCHTLWVWSRNQYPASPGVHPNTRTADLELLLPSGLAAPGVSRELLPARFLSAMAAVKWLLIDGTGTGVVFPKADKYITLGTPQESDAERKDRWRKNRNVSGTSSGTMSRNCPGPAVDIVRDDVPDAQSARPAVPTPDAQTRPQTGSLTPENPHDPAPSGTSPGLVPDKVHPPYTYSINTPLPPSGGERGREIRTASDDPELAATAKKVVGHYRAKVRTAHPHGGAIVLVMQLLADGTPEADLRRRADRYAAHCDRHDTPFNKRQGAGTFFSEKGHHASYADGADSPDPAPKHVPPPRPERRLHLPANDPRSAQDERKAS